MIQEGIGARIRWVRELVEPNAAEASRTLGVDRSTLHKIEIGERAPSVFNIIAIANRYRVTTDFLLRGVMSARMDEELSLKLAALHPELVLPEAYRDARTGTDQDGGIHRKSKTPARVG